MDGCEEMEEGSIELSLLEENKENEMLVKKPVSNLWVEKYKPRHFTDLLSDDVSVCIPV